MDRKLALHPGVNFPLPALLLHPAHFARLATVTLHSNSLERTLQATTTGFHPQHIHQPERAGRATIVRTRKITLHPDDDPDR